MRLQVRHDNNVTWLAFWHDPVTPSSFKYVWLAANSSFKSESDQVGVACYVMICCVLWNAPCAAAHSVQPNPARKQCWSPNTSTVDLNCLLL